MQLFKDLFNAGIINAHELEDISSGADFWDNNVYQVNYCWIGRDIENNEYTPEEYVKDIFNYHDTYEIAIDPFDDYDKKFIYDVNIINELLELAKKKKPDIKTRFRFYTWDEDKKITKDVMSKYDTSMFDEIKIEYRGEQDE